MRAIMPTQHRPQNNLQKLEATFNTDKHNRFMPADKKQERSSAPQFVEQPDDVHRQYIDARSVFTAFEEVTGQAKQVRRGMYWKAQSGRDYLIRTSVNNTQKSLGVRSEQTEETYRRFIDRKSVSEERLGQLQKTMLKHQRLNRALFVGRTPQIVIELLNQITKDGIAEQFIIIGTHALCA
jgi:hypothetical protein